MTIPASRVGIGALFLLVACGTATPASPVRLTHWRFTMPATTATARDVVATYLNASVTGRCASASRLTTKTWMAPIADYCDGSTSNVNDWRRLSSARIHGPFADLSADIHNTRTVDADGHPIPDWVTNYYRLIHTPAGWRIAEACRCQPFEPLTGGPHIG